MAKRRRKLRQGGRKNPRPVPGKGEVPPAAPQVQRDGDLYSGDDWERLRQGARNVAGVRYQLWVTAYFLAESRRGVLPFLKIVPEGFEDIDCFDGDSRRWLVQVKEFGAGAGRVTASSIANAISHAARVAECPDRIVVVTDGQFGSQLLETGCDTSISEISGPGPDNVLSALRDRDYERDEAQALITRTHLVRVPWNVLPLLTRSITDSFGVKPAEAAIISSRLVDDLSEVAADQRSASSHSPGSRVIADLDVLVDRVREVVDVEGLDSAIRAGVCEVADYNAHPGSGPSMFLQGVDALPAHIGADFDVLRPASSRAVQVGLQQTRYVLISGPSGAGKSAQMWRSARDFAPGAQVIRVHRLEIDEEVEELIRYVRLLKPRGAGTIVVCCDDLGRVRTALWPQAVYRLLELSGVALIGAVRSEDFTADLLRGGQLVQLRLDNDTAETIGVQLEHAGVSLALEVAEAVNRADGQLMEYVSLLTTGRRLQTVLASQAEYLLRAQDQTGADIARLVCGAHMLGVSIEASDLERGVGCGRAKLTRELERLQDEHIITTDDQQGWRGLHERRSEVLTELLHRTPPPTRKETLGNVLSNLRPASLPWALRRSIEMFGGISVDHRAVIRTAIGYCNGARDIAILFEGLERADHSVTARVYIPVIEQHRHSRVSVSAFSLFVCADKLSEIEFGKTGNDWLDSMWRAIRACTDELPRRSTDYCEVAATELQADQLISYVVSSELSDAVRTLEATTPYFSLSRSQLSRIAVAFPWPDGVLDRKTRLLHGRLRWSANLAAIEQAAFVDAFGDVASRLGNAVRAHESTVALIAGTDNSVVTIELLFDPDGNDEFNEFDWDLPKNRMETKDLANSRAVELVTYVGECCPELRTVEVRTVLADRSRFAINDFEPGHKRLDVSARPPRTNVRVVTGVIAAIARQVGALSWTELMRTRAQIGGKLTELVSEAPRRLSPYDNAGRGREWSTALAQVERDLLSIGLPPPVSDLDAAGDPIRWDLARDEDKLAVALNAMAVALRRMVPSPPVDRELGQIAAQVQDALKKLKAGLDDPATPTTSQEDALYPRTVEGLIRFRGFLIAVWMEDSIIHQIKGAPTELGETVEALIEAASASQTQTERDELEAAFADLGGIVRIVPADDPSPTSISGHEWVVEMPFGNWEIALQRSKAIDRRAVEVAVTLLWVADDVVLPFAVLLSREEGGQDIPLAADAIRHIPGVRDRIFEPGETSRALSSVVDELTLASWKNARHRMRPKTWPVPYGVCARDHLSKAIGMTHHTTWASDEIVTIIQELIERVEAELLGTSASSIATEFIVPAALSGRELDGDSAESRVVLASLLAIDVDSHLSDEACTT